MVKNNFSNTQQDAETKGLAELICLELFFFFIQDKKS